MSDYWHDEMIKKQILDTEQRNRELQKQAAEEARKSLFDPLVGLFPMMKRQDEERMRRQQELMAEEQARLQRQDEYARQQSESTDPEWLRSGRADSGGYAAMTVEERRDGLLDSWGTDSRGSDLTPDPVLEQDRQAWVTQQLRSEEDQKQAAEEARKSLFDPLVGLFPMMKRQDEERMRRQQELMAEEQARLQRQDEYARQQSESTDPEWLRSGRADSGGYAAMTVEERRDGLLDSWGTDSRGSDLTPDPVLEQDRQAWVTQQLRSEEDQKQAAEEARKSLFDPLVGLFPMMKRQDEERMRRQQELMAEEQARLQRQDEYARQQSESTDSQIRANAAKGAEFEREMRPAYESAGFDVKYLRKEVRVETPHGIRYPDAAIFYKGKLVEYIEFKSSSTAEYSKAQQQKDESIYKNGGPITSVVRPDARRKT